jgi:hypothetical protein
VVLKVRVEGRLGLMEQLVIGPPVFMTFIAGEFDEGKMKLAGVVEILGLEFQTMVTEGSVMTVPLVAAERTANPIDPDFTCTLVLPEDPVVPVAPVANVGVMAPTVLEALKVTVLPKIGFP